MMSKSARILEYGGVDRFGRAVFGNGLESDMRNEDVTDIRLPVQDWRDFGEPRQITVTIHPGDQLNLQGDRRPHSRACGFRKHDHGPECARDCPTCNSPANAIAGEKLAD